MIHKNLRVIREVKGLSQEYVAKELGISQNAYSKIERGEIKLDDEKLTKIATVLKVTVDTIKTFSESVIFNNKDCQHIGYNHNTYNNPLDKIVELYERLLNEKDKKIEALQKIKK